MIVTAMKKEIKKGKEFIPTREFILILKSIRRELRILSKGLTSINNKLDQILALFDAMPR